MDMTTARAARRQVDLTGPMGAWPPGERQLFERCWQAALAEPGVWSTAPRTGLPRLREALARELGLKVGELAVGTGVRAQSAEMLADAESLIIEHPTFSDIPQLARERGVTVLARTWEEILAGDDVSGNTVVWITSPARNPDGRTLTPAEARRLDELASNCRRVVVNQTYHWVAPQAPRPRDAVLLGSLHKIAGGGSAVGWQSTPGGAGPGRPAGGGPPTAWQLAWAAFAEQGGLRPLAEHALQAPSLRCRRFADSLRLPAGVRLLCGEGPSLLLAFSRHLDEHTVCSAFARCGLKVGAGSAFGWRGTAVRMSFTGVADTALRDCVRSAAEAFLLLDLS